MKKLILILFGLLISHMLEAQSWSLFDIDTAENLNKVYFTNDINEIANKKKVNELQKEKNSSN